MLGNSLVKKGRDVDIRIVEVGGSSPLTSANWWRPARDSRRTACTSDTGRANSSPDIATGRPQPRLATLGRARVPDRPSGRVAGGSTDTVRRWADAGRVKATQASGGRRHVDGADLARLAVELAGEQGRHRSRGQSARNHFRGIVTRVTKDGVAAHVEVQSGPHRLVALITREAVDELELEPGMIADAVVKATNVGIEVPAES